MTGTRYDELTSYTWGAPRRERAPVAATVPQWSTEPSSTLSLPSSGSYTAAAPLTAFGEILVTTADVRTPAGTFPLGRCTWAMAPAYRLVEDRPDWALPVALAAIPATLGFSLFVLLVKESRPQGTVAVTVGCGSASYTQHMPVRSMREIYHIHMQLGYVRQWTDSTRRRRR